MTIKAINEKLNLVPLEAAPDHTMIEMLDEVYALVDEGKISGISMAIVYRDGLTGDCRSNLPNLGAMIGAVTILQQRLVAEITRSDEA